MNDEPWEDLVSPKVGLITKLLPQFRGPDEPVPPHLYTAMLAHFDFRAAVPRQRLCAGKGLTEREAKLAALGEAVERYCAFHVDPNRRFMATWAAVADAGISPTECVLYSDRQYSQPGWNYQRFVELNEIAWVRSVELPRAEEVALPASLVYLAESLPRDGDLFTPVTSNGLAAGPTLEAAILNGLCELIERDALMITWMNQLPAIEIEIPKEGNVSAAVVRQYVRLGVEVRAFLLRTDQIARVVMAVASDTAPDRPARLIGMGCDLDPRVALEKAIFELCQARPSEMIRYRENPPAGRLNSYQDVVEMNDHSAFHSLAENSREFEFLWSTGERQPLRSIGIPEIADAKSNLDICVRRLVDTGHRVAYADLTTPDVASAGFRVVRTIATDLQPIHFGWGKARLGGRRLFEAPVSWGLFDRTRSAEELNPCPHPLA